MVQLPPNNTGQVLDTFTTIALKERQVTVPPFGGQFCLSNVPATATQATISAPAIAGVSNVCTGIYASEVTIGTAQTAITLNLRDGATGAGTVLMSFTIAMTTNQQLIIATQVPHIKGTAGNAMTLEFSAAGATATSQSVNLTGYTTA